MLWHRRAWLAAMIAATAVWDWVLLCRYSGAPGLRWVILAGGLATAAAMLIPARALGRAGLVAAAGAVLAATTTRWAAAANGSMQAAPLQLASGKAVMSIGGFTGSDPAPTLEQFQQYVAAGEIRYYIGTGQGGGGGRGGNDSQGSGSAIQQWVAAHYTAATTVGGATVYDLTKPNA